MQDIVFRILLSNAKLSVYLRQYDIAQYTINEFNLCKVRLTLIPYSLGITEE